MAKSKSLEAGNVGALASTANTSESGHVLFEQVPVSGNTREKSKAYATAVLVKLLEIKPWLADSKYHDNVVVSVAIPHLLYHPK